MLCNRLQQEVQDQEIELKQERERLLVLSRAESDLSARLQGETEKAKSLDSTVSELKEQLHESVMKCHEVENTKVSLEALLQGQKDQHQSALHTAQEDVTQAHEQCAQLTVECAELKSRLAIESEKRMTAEATNTQVVERLEHSVTQEQVRAESLSRELHTSEARLVQVNHELERTKAATVVLTAESIDLRQAAATNEGRVSGIESEMKRILQTNEVKEETLRQAISQLQADTRSSADLAAQLTKACSEVDFVKAELQLNLVAQRESLIELNDNKAK